MFCKICQKEIEPEIGEIMAGNCIFREYRCPKHHLVLNTHIERLEPLKQERLEKVGEIIKNYKIKEKLSFKK